MEKSAAELVDELNKTDESERVEAKACTSGNPGSAVLKTISAFSNEPDLGGGFVVFGVTRQDDGNYKIAGVTDPDRLQTEFGSRCASDFNIRIRPSISVETVQGKTVVVAKIPEADPSKKPVYLKATGLPKGAYRRIGSADQRCTDDDVSQLYASSGSTSFDATVQEHASLDELDSSAIEDYRQTVRENGNGGEFLSWGDKKLMRSLRCLEVSDSGDLRPTVAGILLFGAPVTLRRLFPSMYVDYIRVRGKEWVENPTQRHCPSCQASVRAYSQ
jgi:ATP-dependent DNA helicase RecG